LCSVGFVHIGYSLYTIAAFEGYVYVRVFEKVCNLSDLWAVVCEGSPFVLFFSLRFFVVLWLYCCVVFCVVFSVGMGVSFVEMSNFLLSPLCGKNKALRCFHLLHEQFHYRTLVKCLAAEDLRDEGSE